MISVELLAKHMAWANQEIFKEVKKLGPDVLDYYVIDKEWIKAFKGYLVNIGKNSLPNYKSISPSAPNSHRININDERFMIQRASKNYSDYTQWDKIRVQSLEYKVSSAFKKPIISPLDNRIPLFMAS